MQLCVTVNDDVARSLGMRPHASLRNVGFSAYGWTAVGYPGIPHPCLAIDRGSNTLFLCTTPAAFSVIIY